MIILQFMKGLFFLFFCTAALLQQKNNNSRLNQPERLQMIKQIPVLTYHNIHKNTPKENALYISEEQFIQQMKGLSENGYHTVLPNQLAAYFQTGAALPQKPVMISFDDSHEEQASLAAPVLNRFGFKAVYFVMTVCIDKKGFLSSAQIKKLALEGHIIGAHTWNHPNLKRQLQVNWNRQLDQPGKVLETITGKPVDCFAYPYGEWNDHTVSELKKRHILTAFQLTGRISNADPLLTIRRIMVNGSWSASKLINQMHAIFR